MLRHDLGRALDLFAAASRVHEPPTWDVLLINVAGTGAGSAHLDGPNPRRPLYVPLRMQRADTV